MPYKSEKIVIKNTEFDRRVKLTIEQKEQIKKEHESGMSKHSLSRKYNVSRRLIQIITDENVANRIKEQSNKYCKENRQSGETWAKTIREHRQYKQKLYIDNKISLENFQKQTE